MGIKTAGSRERIKLKRVSLLVAPDLLRNAGELVTQNSEFRPIRGRQCFDHNITWSNGGQQSQSCNFPELPPQTVSLHYGFSELRNDYADPAIRKQGNGGPHVEVRCQRPLP